MGNKVPVVTFAFWVIKVLSTTVGETGADFLALNLGLGGTITTLVMVALLAGALYVQMRSRFYMPWKYWLTVVLVSIVGTLLTDVLTDMLDVPLFLCTAVFAAALLLSFAIWYKLEQTLSIQAITSIRREAFYWLAILLTFALGTAAGDLATEACSWALPAAPFCSAPASPRPPAATSPAPTPSLFLVGLRADASAWRVPG